MHVPNALATLNDPMTIPALISCLNLPEDENTATTQNDNSDSDDEMFAEIGNKRLTQECVTALGSYMSTHAAARAAIERASRDKRGFLRDMAHAVLFYVRGDDASRTYLANILLEDAEKLDFMAI
jgi:hypothetical protein